MKSTILVVDDEILILNLLTLLIESGGYNVITAVTPVDALDIVNNYDGIIDLVLTDISMPEMTGPELVEKIQKKFKKIKYIFMSGAPIELNHDIVNNNAYFIQKPFMNKKLLELLKNILNN